MRFLTIIIASLHITRLDMMIRLKVNEQLVISFMLFMLINDGVLVKKTKSSSLTTCKDTKFRLLSSFSLNTVLY